ncbi:MAG: hypothetical protein HYS32_03365 [Candidatus Woesearchaeota archaeon]|nr:MAG: hypothetical protein HYS32_03365 [Candidatus Woesearchaeota archaeon]
MKKLIIIILILLVLGLWFYTEATKDAVKTTGGLVIDTATEVGEKTADIVREKVTEAKNNE